MGKKKRKIYIGVWHDDTPDEVADKFAAALKKLGIDAGVSVKYSSDELPKITYYVSN